jgi:hypothetical protein
MQLRRLNGCFGSVVAAWNLVLRVIFPKGDAESSAPGFRERPLADPQVSFVNFCFRRGGFVLEKWTVNKVRLSGFQIPPG